MFFQKIFIGFFATLALFIVPALAAAETGTPWKDGRLHVVWNGKPDTTGCINVTGLSLDESGRPVYGCLLSETELESWHMVSGDTVGKEVYRMIHQIDGSELQTLRRVVDIAPSKQNDTFDIMVS